MMFPWMHPFNFFIKFDKRFKEMDLRLDKAETKSDNNEKEIGALRKELEAVKKELKETKPAACVFQQEIKSAVFSELSDRKLRRHNVVIHGLTEAPPTVKGLDRVPHDMERIKELLAQIEVQMEVSDLVKYSRRLGPVQGRRNPDKPRPLLIGVASDKIVEQLTDSSRTLKGKPEPWKFVSIVRDLTRHHREEEKKMFKEVEELAKALSEDDAKKFSFKVVGGRGARRIVKVLKTPEDQGAMAEEVVVEAQGVKQDAATEAQATAVPGVAPTAEQDGHWQIARGKQRGGYRGARGGKLAPVIGGPASAVLDRPRRGQRSSQ